MLRIISSKVRLTFIILVEIRTCTYGKKPVCLNWSVPPPSLPYSLPLPSLSSSLPPFLHASISSSLILPSSLPPFLTSFISSFLLVFFFPTPLIFSEGPLCARYYARHHHTCFDFITFLPWYSAAVYSFLLETDRARVPGEP